MKKVILLSCAALWIVSGACAQTLSQADRENGVKYLEQTRDGVVAAVAGLSEAQWKFKEAPDRWSIAETLEHIALAEDYLFDTVKAKVMTSPSGAADRDITKIDAAVLAMVPDRSHKFQAPPPLVPSGRWSPQETLDHFLKSRARTIEYMKTTQGLRDHVMDGPIGQPMDAYEWLLFIGAHSARHTKQMLEVEAAANYPKS